MIFYGRNVVKEALTSKFKSHKLYIQNNINKDNKISEIIALAKSRAIHVEDINPKKLSKLTNSNEHQGIAIEIDYSVEKLSSINIPDFNDSFIYISDVTYEHNIGAIIRSAECSGLKGVIIPNNTNITGTVAKISTGALFHIPVYREAIFNSIKFFKDLGFKIVGIERDGEKYFESDLSGNNLLIIGGEDKSLSDRVRKKSDLIVEIPQFGKVNSLNMSVAASIIMFDRVRQVS
ncbi:MAG: 23S rRNA (guanosine(2251)-2'-O)-methyltransferase RlmB [Candidatus Dojkabacteria bacterium]|nr:23S rRNA (guanosine(2251)-2'-O)-methyltransferase RlmB [Candidatus Dojkabacteria bacterium]MDQ7021775.1 23S rRNA (guanosine(2251)-2'-O)-methyltransferase RlmB [Candidatus Dojkabacteria bacterium]